MNGGERIAEVLARHRVDTLFTLCGGHISPILVGARQRGIRVVDTRHEAAAVFAADAWARLTGRPGVAAVTAGPGVTNALTALKNAQLAQSPVLLLGGATATVLEGRGSLQDIEQLPLVDSIVKWRCAVTRVRDLAPAVELALFEAGDGVPGPVFVECPVDLLYDEATVREWYGMKSGGDGGARLGKRLERRYLEWHLGRIFRGSTSDSPEAVRAPRTVDPRESQVRKAADLLAAAERPVLLAGSQVVSSVDEVPAIARAVADLGLPVYLSGMARGLVGGEHPRQFRHRRREALREADLVLLAGVPADFRLDYGRQFGRAARLVSVNRSRADLGKNRRPQLGVAADPGAFLVALARRTSPAGADRWSEWVRRLAARDAEREREIDAQAEAPAASGVHPLRLFRELDRLLEPGSVLVADGGDFVATAAYTLRPRAPLSWLDPGVFGTLGVGGGFATGVATARAGAEIWILYGDGSAGYSLAEFDTYVRHGIAPIAIVGNDASWAQIARDQVAVLGDDVGTVLRHTDYERVAEGFGGAGLRIEMAEEIAPTLRRARELARGGKPVLVNVLLAPSDFRKGSLSM